jgi:hypothetical protein
VRYILVLTLNRFLVGLKDSMPHPSPFTAVDSNPAGNALGSSGQHSG